MRYLRDHNYTLLTFERWQDVDKVNKPIFITFDDGYKNNRNAFVCICTTSIREENHYLSVDFYRYFIGREDQSVNESVMIR